MQFHRIAGGGPGRLLVPVLAALVLSVYWQAGDFALLHYEDASYVSDNPFVMQGLTRQSTAWAFTTFHAVSWQPLTWLSFMADVELFGPSPGWHHRVNVAFHLLNTIALFLVLNRMTGAPWRSALAAALFGVHPLRVESVAWVSERKDVLSTLFWILAMGAYVRYARRPGVGRYLPVAGLFAAGLLCKPMLVTLPFALLLLDWWPLGRMAPAGPADPRGPAAAFRRLVLEKVPLFALSALSSVVTFTASLQGGGTASLQEVPFGLRVANAIVSYAAYLGNTVWPSSLAVFYPHPASLHADIPGWQVAGSLAVLGGITLLAILQRGRRPCLAVGWFWFLGTLVPVIGLTQTGWQARADRFTYVPLIGLFLAVAWALPEAPEGRRFRRIAAGALVGAAILALAAASWRQAGYWRNDLTLFSRALAVTENNWLAWGNLGSAYAALGRGEDAVSCLREALRIGPGYAEGWNNLGAVCDKLGRTAEAVGYYRRAIEIVPRYAAAWYNLGTAHARLRDLPGAVQCFRTALRIRPNHADAWDDLGVTYGALGQPLQAEACFREAVRIKPDFAEAWNNLGTALRSLGRHEEAVACYREAVRIKAGYATAWRNLGSVYEMLGRRAEAEEAYREWRTRLPPDRADRERAASSRRPPK